MIDTELMFECLIHLNMFYYAVFGTCDIFMTIAKYVGPRETLHIYEDGAVMFTKLAAELAKILLFRRYKEERRRLVTAAAVGLTFVTMATLYYGFFIQTPVIRLEYMLNSLTVLLTVTEVVFGILDLLPCCKKRK
ncbi:hypothetical protein NQ314_005637 [Rhamnusium bicolor]|uniref:Uncharacterized protein n=1 Tax=Rhamnusium bicolor TaxID=1586634 RepID=A0AAV8ZF79_9CUCU|nr:hypothetical protein NQ314_005637 [Rhamnusium bicolor]